MSLHIPSVAVEQLKAEALRLMSDDGDRDYASALTLLSEAIAAQPLDAHLWMARCTCLVALDRIADALSDANRCVELRSDWPKAHYRRGIVLQLLGSAAVEDEGHPTHPTPSSSSPAAYLADTHAAFADGLRLERPENAVARAATCMVLCTGLLGASDPLALLHSLEEHLPPLPKAVAFTPPSLSSPSQSQSVESGLDIVPQLSPSASQLPTSESDPSLHPPPPSHLTASSSSSLALAALENTDPSLTLADDAALVVDGSADSSANERILSLAEEMAEASPSSTSLPAPASEPAPPPAPVFKFQIVTDWLRAGGASFDNLYIPENESEPASGEHAAAAPSSSSASSASTSAISGVYLRSSVSPGVPLLRVPLSHIMTSETAFASDIGQAIIRAEQRGGLMLRSKHSFLAAFLLVERVKGEASFWWPYIQCLPTAYDHVPIHYSDSDLALLQGSMVLSKIADRRDSLRAEFVELQRHLGADLFGRFSLEEFVWARNVVVTRIFGMVVGGKKTDGLVPMADLLNHRRPRETKWTFDDASGAFTVTSLRALQGGCQVHDSYGRKCNSRFFVNYGFALEENADNEARFVFAIAPSDPFFDLRIRLLGGSSNPSGSSSQSNHALSQREFSLVGAYSSKDAHVREAFSFLRFAFARAAEVSVLAAAKDFRIADVAPISVANELRVLEQVRACAAQSLDEFDASVEQDDFILANDAALTRPQRSCVIMRRGEKLVYHMYIRMADACCALLESSWRDVKKTVTREYATGTGPFDEYVATVVVPLVKAAHAASSAGATATPAATAGSSKRSRSELRP